jgi:ABC-type uncharacterized transport system substrate-binding protein
MTSVGDPVRSGPVASLAYPGGNVTGLSMMITDLATTRLQLLKEAIPRLTRVAVLWNPDAPLHSKWVQDLKAVGPSLAIELNFVVSEHPSSSVQPSRPLAKRTPNRYTCSTKLSS